MAGRPLRRLRNGTVRALVVQLVSALRSRGVTVTSAHATEPLYSGRGEIESSDGRIRLYWKGGDYPYVEARRDGWESTVGWTSAHTASSVLDQVVGSAINPLRRNPSEGERHISYEEQERRRKLYAPSREKEAERRRLRAALAILAKAHVGGLRTLVKHAKEAGLSARGEQSVIPTDNFWYAWLLAAIARGVVENRSRDGFTKQLSNMTLREIAKMADTDPSFYDT